MKRIAAIPVFAVVCLVSTASAQKVTKPPKVAAAPAPHAPTIGSPPKQVEPPEAPASPQYLDKLLKLTPEQRKKALSALPPARRANIERKLNDYQKLSPEQRAKDLDRFQRMHNLPPQKMAQVRASLKRYTELPPDRHRLVYNQIEKMKPLSAPDRRALMNSEEFRNKFTPSEQQMLEDISLVTPRS